MQERRNGELLGDARADLGSALDLTECDREPIHLLGAVQPHGALLAVDDDGVVRAATANTAEFFGRTARHILGADVATVLGREAVGRLRALGNEWAPSSRNGLLATTVNVGDAQEDLDVSVHLSDGLQVLEFERAQREGPFGFSPYYGGLRRAMFRLQSYTTVHEVCDAVVTEVRQLTGFDRVMVYRFASDGHGAVIAEAVRDDWEPYLGLHYPASDIPVQARALYELNWIRAIERVDYQPVDILLDAELADRLGRPLDLSGSVLRSVSPVHRQYLRNMGVDASMSVSILRDGRLWGLIACHHGSPRWPPSEFRAACELLGVAVSMQLSGLEQQDDVGYRERIASTQLELLNNMARGGDVVPGLVAGQPSMLDMVHAHGASVRIGGDHVRLGRTPTAEGIDRILAALPPGAPGEVLLSSSLRELDPSLEDLADVASGALVVRLDREGVDHLMWVRGEVLQSVTWAGDPTKPVASTPEGSRLSPRASFAAWQEVVRFHSQPWSDLEREAAHALWRAVSEVMLRRAVEMAQLNDELSRSNHELDAFAYVASHDLKEPLRGISNYTTFVLEDHSDALGDEARDRLETVRRLSERMDLLLDSLLQFSRVGRMDLHLEPVSLDTALDDSIEVLAPALAEADIRRTGSLPWVHADGIRVHEVFTNLLSNAVKYRQPGRPLVIIIEAQHRRPGTLPDSSQTGEVLVSVQDNGIGIPAERVEDVFRIFRRLHRREEFGGGAGVGLTIARKIVERHGGRMWVESELGEGSTFWFSLPTAPDWTGRPAVDEVDGQRRGTQ